MDEAAKAAWAQAILSGLAILFSSGFAVWVPWRERRAKAHEENRRRLNVTTLRSAPSGLRIEIGYLPEFTHIGLKARVTLKSPAGAVLHHTRPETNPAPIDGNYLRHVLDGAAIDGTAVVRLSRLDNEEAFSGVVLLLPSHDAAASPASIIPKANIVFDIETDAGERLLSVPLEVSPIDERR